MSENIFEYKEHVKKWLSGYTAHMIYIDSLFAEIEAIDSTKNRLTSILSFTPKGAGTDIANKWIRAIEKADAIKEEIAEMIEEAVEEVAKIKNAIDNLDDPNERMIMSLRYINRREWEDIVKDPNVLYSRRQIFRIHDRALLNIVISE